jgi:hypothetical protein
MSHVDYLLADRDRLIEDVTRLNTTLGMLKRRGIVTFDEAEAETCCGMSRDEDGFCTHRPHHPIYVRIPRDR